MAPITSATNVYSRMLQLKRKNAYTKIPIITSSFNSSTCRLVVWANGMSSTRPAAFSVVPSTASKPPMIRMVVEQKNEGVCDRLWVMSPSSMRGSRPEACIIHRTR